jgi:hypothetical protein
MKDESKAVVVAAKEKRAFLHSKQRRRSIVFGGRRWLLQLKCLEILGNPLQTSTSILAPDFDSRVLVTGFYLDRSYALPFKTREDFNSNSILDIVSKSAAIPNFILTGAARSWLRNIGVSRHFHVGLLSREFDLILPTGLRVATSGQSTQEVGILDAGLNTHVGSGIDASHEFFEDGKRSDFAMSSFLASMPSWGMLYLLISSNQLTCFLAHRVIVKADPENLIDRLLPAEIIPAGARHIAACFWSFLCVVDGKKLLTKAIIEPLTQAQDLTEAGDCYNCIETCIEALSTVTTLSGLSVKILGLSIPRDLSERSKLDDCKTIMAAFHNTVSTTRLSAKINTTDVSVIEAWKVDFWLEVLSVIKALQAEKSLGHLFSMRDWIQLRLITISARPFMVLVRASLGLPATLHIAPPCIKQMEVIVQAVMGLQNDLIGWQKDHTEGNQLNAVEVLIRQGYSREEAFAETLSAHNNLVQSLLCLSELDSTATNVTYWTMYICTTISFCEAMAEWMLTSRRYRIEQIVVPGLMRLMYHDSNSMHNNIFRV